MLEMLDARNIGIQEYRMLGIQDAGIQKCKMLGIQDARNIKNMGIEKYRNMGEWEYTNKAIGIKDAMLGIWDNRNIG